MDKNKNKFRIIGIILTVVIVVSAVGIYFFTRNAPKPVGLSTDIYFYDAATNMIKPEQHNIMFTERKDLLGKVLGEIILGPKPSSNLSPVMPKDVKILTANLNDDSVQINLSSDFNNAKVREKLFFISSLVWSITDIDSVSKVNILVDGAPLKGIDGKPLADLTRQDVVINPLVSPEPVNYQIVRLYFLNADFTQFKVEERTIQVNPNQPVEKFIVEKLIEGPTEKDFYSTIPSETKVRDIKTIEEVCYVDLSNEFVSKQQGGADQAAMSIYSIVNTLTELRDVKKVQILIEGEKPTDFKGHFDLSKPLERKDLGENKQN